MVELFLLFEVEVFGHGSGVGENGNSSEGGPKRPDAAL